MSKKKANEKDRQAEELLGGSLLLPDKEGGEFTWAPIKVSQGGKSWTEYRRNFRAVRIVDGQIEDYIVKARGRTLDLGMHDLSRRVAERDNVWADQKRQNRPWIIEQHSLGGNRVVYVVKPYVKTVGPKERTDGPTLVGGDAPSHYLPVNIKVDRTRATVGELWVAHRDAARVAGEAKGQYSDYTKDKDTQYGNFLDAEGIGSERMSALATERVKGTMDAYSSSHRPTTTFRFSVAMYAFGKWAVECDAWPKNLFAEHPRGAKDGDKDPGRVLSYMEIDAWFRYAAGKPWMLAALWLLRIGCRAEDVLGLSERDVLGNDTIIVRSSQKRDAKGNAGPRRERGERLCTGKPKGFSRRKIYVGEHIVSVLRESLKTAVDHDVRCHMAGMELVARKFVVHNRFGEMYGATGYAEQMREACDKIGFVYGVEAELFGEALAKTQYSHMWKHTFASELVALGADDVELKEVARHADVDTTKRIYAKSRDESKRLLRHYANLIEVTRDYIPTIVQMDLDRRAGKDPWESGWAMERPLEYLGLLKQEEAAKSRRARGLRSASSPATPSADHT